MSFADELGIRFTVETPDYVEASMPLSPRLHQPFGFVHGGVTLALLETVASKGAELRCDFDTSLPFGIHTDIRHRKSAQAGTLRGVAKLNREEGIKQFWDVAAYDDEGDIISDGVFMTKVVPLTRLAEKEQERAAARAQASSPHSAATPQG